jgi:hypothetical protein
MLFGHTKDEISESSINSNVSIQAEFNNLFQVYYIPKDFVNVVATCYAQSHTRMKNAVNVALNSQSGGFCHF